MNKWLTIFLVWISIHASATANNPIDSLKQQLGHTSSDTMKISILNQIGKVYEIAGNDSALLFYMQAQNLSEEINEKGYQALCEKNFGCFYLQNSTYDTALTHHNKALELYTQLGDSVQIADQYKNISDAYSNTSQFDKALNYKLKAIEIYENLGMKKDAVILNSSLSGIYMRLNNPDQALKCHFDVINYKPRSEVENDIPSSYVNIGYINFQLQKYDEALKYYKMSLEYAQKINSKFDIALGHSIVGKVYLRMQRYAEAEEEILKAKPMFEELNDKLFLNKVNINLMELYNALGKYEKAENYALETIKISKEINVLWMENLAQYGLSVSYYQRGMYKKAYDAHVAHKAVNNQILIEGNTKQIADIHVKYETEKKEHENALLRKDNEIQKLELIKQQRFRNLLIALIISGILLGVLLFSRYQIKKKANKRLHEKNKLIEKQQEELTTALEQLKETNDELEHQKEEILTQSEILAEANATKNKFFSIIAHDLKSPFSAMIGLCDILLRKYDHYEDEKRVEILQSVSDTAGNTYNLLENLLVWARSQSNRIEINKEELLLADLVKGSIQPYLNGAESKNIKVQNLISNGKKINADKYTISVVLGNLFSNAVKFTDNGGSIKLDAQQNNGHVEIAIHDTGVGIAKQAREKLFKITENQSTPGTQNEAGTGLGLILCKEFVERNNGQIKVDSKEGEGTIFTISIPV